jgi:Secretion system C-terminal sorting domain
LWVENVTTTGGGLTFLQQNELSDFAYFNHNTIVNNTKCWLLSIYYRSLFVTNNIFINQNWAGEDINELSSGEDPRKEYQSTIDIDSVNVNEGVIVQPKYYAGDDSHYSSLLALNRLQVYVSNNINYYDPLLINGYYHTFPGTFDSTAYPLSYLNWAGAGNGPWVIGNIPGEWMNARTRKLFVTYAPPNGGFVQEYTDSVSDPGTVTKGIADAFVATTMGQWNQYQWGDPRFPTPSDILQSKYIFGDYDPLTIPGRDAGGNKTEDGSGISSFTDLTENFSQSSHLSKIDNLPLGSLIWDDEKLAAFKSVDDWAKVYSHYLMAVGVDIVNQRSIVPTDFSLAQNYPNPFNNATQIRFSVPPNNGDPVTLRVYNVLGQEVALLYSGPKVAGSYTMPFDGSGLGSGVYFYRLQSGNTFITKKMILMK